MSNHPLRFGCRAASALLLVAATLPLGAQTSPRSFSIRATDQPIEIDGELGDPGWTGATVVDLPWEWDPGQNIETPVRTVAYISYSKTHLYIAWRCFDPQPERIRAHLMDRDDTGTLVQDDHILVTIDTFNDNRRGYQFRVNPLGVQADAILSVNGSFEDFSFDMIWKSAGRVDDQGYIVEMAIPFNQMRFPRAPSMVWGFDLQRSYPRSVRHRLSSEPFDRNNNCLLCQVTKIEGFEGLEPGRNLEITPTLTGVRGETRDPFPDGRLGTRDENLEGGVSARFGITPSMSLNAAINPDFSQVEADAAQLDVNERFALFFEEKRPFFLEGADFFTTPMTAVFTRTVVDPDWGLKLTGKSGKNAIGVFAARDSVNSLLMPGNQFSQSAFLDDDTSNGVLRYRRDLGTNSTLGLLWTGRESTDYSNHTFGADGFLRFNQRNTLQVQYLHSETRYPNELAAQFDQPLGSFSDDAFQLGYNYDSRTWSAWFWVDDLGRDFRADSGFIPQVDVRSVNFGVHRTFWGGQEEWWDQITSFVRYSRFEDQDGLLTNESYETSASLRGPLQSFFEASFRYGSERFQSSVYDDMFLWQLIGRVQPSGALSLNLSLSRRDQIDLINNQLGEQWSPTVGVEWKIGRRINSQLNHTLRRLDVPGGQLFEANLSELRLVYNFNVRSFIRGIFQYQDIERDPKLYPFSVEPDEQTLFTQLLYSYKINPQTVLFVGYSDNRLGIQGISLTETERTFFLKLGYAWSP